MGGAVHLLRWPPQASAKKLPHMNIQMASSLASKFARLTLAISVGALLGKQAYAETFESQLAQAKCLLAMAQGRTISETDPKFNTFWNTVNEGVHRFMVEDLQRRNVRVVSDFYPVEARDADKVWAGVATKAAKHACERLLQVNVYPFDGKEVVVEVRINTLLIYRSEINGKMSVNVGDTIYQRERRYVADDWFKRDTPLDVAAAEYVRELVSAEAP